MQVLPSGLVVPPLPYAAALVAGAFVVVSALWRLRPAVTDRVVLAATPWMVLGGGLHGLLQYGLVWSPLEPLLTAPAVYLTTAVAAGAVWAGSTVLARRPGTYSPSPDGGTPDVDRAR
ncbi:hypothetical protein BRD17_08660, partial [Halobacteriales archaeon SW_7_68_16]